MSLLQLQRILTSLVAIAAIVLPNVAHACPMCFDGNNTNADAFLYGSFLLMGVPVVAIGGLAYWAYRRITTTDRADSAHLDTGTDQRSTGTESSQVGGVVVPLAERR